MNESNISALVWESPVPPVLQFVFGVLGNSIALIVLVCNSPNHRWHPFYKLVAGLALTDGGGILLLYPPILTRYATNFTFNLNSFLCGYTSFLASFTILSSALIVCAMSIDRCVAVYSPFYYKREYGDRRRVVAVIGAIWAAGGLVSSLHLAGLGSVYKFYPGSWCFLNFISGATVERANSLIYSGLGILVLLITVTLNLSVIVVTLHKKHRAHLGRLRKDVYNIVFLSAIVLISSISWAPLMWRILSVSCDLSPPNQGTELLALRLAVSGSIVDPWIYILLRKETLKYVHKMAQRYQTKYDVNPQSSTSHNMSSMY